MVLNINTMLERLHVQSDSDQLYLEESNDVYGDVVAEENDATTYNNPVIDRVIEDSGVDGFRTLTNFTPDEFDTIWSVVEMALQARWHDGRGRRPLSTPKDALFMTLVILKYYQTWQKHALDFDINAPTLEKMIIRVVDVISPIIYAHFVTMPTMEALREHSTTFRNYPYAKYATDVKFQPSHRPSGRFGEQKHYFSGKHKLYGLKIEASVSAQGLLVDMGPHEPGSVADLTMFRKRLDVHVTNLKKTPTEATVNDNGERFQAFSTMWAVFVDKGYYGLTASVRAIHQKKRPSNAALDRPDLKRNSVVSSDRVIVENFFGGVCTLWKISYSTFVWGEKIYDGIQRLTFALTNFHVGLIPLRDDDLRQNRVVLARYARMAEEKKSQRAATQCRYIHRRAERLATESMRSSLVARGAFLSSTVNTRR
ncbi:hypothetical protein H257_10914 [Aphanomyces astaci]|uniref:DDE Tnp4 domain-containing protein n=1 Tax=Aphanomyces astaci TaxID=112090 RepID=W4G3M1_APHAT|nr:hypothetical protein H257_10914 [Aphanomyces astaci]ETV74307.1 hypothetical protein H257_10914 [Aphanomyces astaci]|eukprot:XP_009835965.1 hypothetical protein H257_10914 [Aphanomyces astaci]